MTVAGQPGLKYLSQKCCIILAGEFSSKSLALARTARILVGGWLLRHSQEIAALPDKL